MVLLAKVDSNGNHNLFTVEHDENGLWLCGNYGNLDNKYHVGNRFAFRCKSVRFSLSYFW